MAELFDIVVRRQIYIEGLKASKGLEFAAVLGKLRTELAVRLYGFEWDDLGNATRTSLRKLIVDLRRIAKTIFDPYLAALIDWLQRFVKIDLGLLANVYRQAVPEAAPAIDSRAKEDDSAAAMWALALGLPMAATGTLALPFLAALLPSIAVKLERVTLQHYANRSSKSELINAIVGPANAKEPQGLLKQLNNQSKAATNTVIQHLATQVSEALGAAVASKGLTGATGGGSDGTDDKAKVIGLYEWVSVLDDRTTEICLSRDGNRYVFGRGPVPPAHVGCRSTIVPVRAGAPSTPNNFGDWLRGQPDEFVNDALDGRRSARYGGSPPLSLGEYGSKSPLIGA